MYRMNGMWGRLTPAAWRWPPLGWLELGFALVVLLAAAMRLWELDGRVMHYDEAIHLHYAWKLARGVEFLHSPWMHGPLQMKWWRFSSACWAIRTSCAVAIRAVWRRAGDSAVFSTSPDWRQGIDLRRGHHGVFAVAAVFQPFGRNDILMVVWATLLLIFLWRYTESGKLRYLLGTAAVTALMLASKETAYFIILFMGLAALGLGWRQLWDVARRRAALADAGAQRGFSCCWQR